MFDTVSKLYNKLLEKYFDECVDLLEAKKSKMDPKFDPTNLTLDEYDYDKCYKKSDCSTVKGDEEELDDLPRL